MGGIGGNTDVAIQVMAGERDNGIGQKIPLWETALEVRGWLDLLEGSSSFSKQNAKIQESTHVFICDYLPLEYRAGNGDATEITPENSRMVVAGKVYGVMLYDDPMGLHGHLEIYLQYMGGMPCTSN